MFNNFFQRPIFDNMIRSLIAILALTLTTLTAFSQDKGNYDFHPPLKIPLILSSNFGELRPNHFHMGLDFKTQGKIGYRLYSIDDGFVSRVKVSAYGYGKVVYIDHPNGMTSVYAHISEFKGEIDSLIRATQEKEQNYEVEVFPARDEIKVKKGQVIALSGNTGSSGGPHLHFEIRDTETEHALNPLLYGFPIEDHKKPEMRRVKIYGITQHGYRIPGKAVEKTLVRSGSNYAVSGNTITINPRMLTKDGGLGFAFDVIDRFDGAGNQCGLFGSRLIVDGDTVFGQETVRVPFESSRYVNSHKDYEAYQANKSKYHKCFRTEENDLPIYINNTIGLVKSAPGKSHKVKYIAFDAAGNKSTLEFTLKVNAGEINPTTWGASTESNIHPKETFEFDFENVKLEGGYATVYEPMQIDLDALDHTIGNRENPVNRTYQIKVMVDGPQDGKHYLEMITAKGKRRIISVSYLDDWAVANCKYFGTYSLKRDETPPNVKLVSYSTVIPASAQSISWAISDNTSGIEDYDLFIDGKWYLIEYEYKTGKVTFQKPTGFKGKKQVKIIVKDACGNEKVIEMTLDFR